MSTPMILAVSVALVALSAFFVAVEFSLIAAKRHRFEELAPTSRAARAALRSSGDLTLLLAGSQLGITLCTLALGAVTKPAVHHAITPWIETWGLGSTAADVLSFTLALFVVTFVHLVIGEMMPKSWAIAHPERSAIALALPMRAFMVVARPLLIVLNGVANALLRRAGVEPTDEVSESQDASSLEHLVAHSARSGTLGTVHSRHLQGTLALRDMTLGDLVRARERVTDVPVEARVGDVWAIAQAAGHLRVLVGERPRYEGAVHVRDTITRHVDDPIDDLVHPIATFDVSTSVSEAMRGMRERRQHLAVVMHGATFMGVVSLSDILKALFPADTSGHERAPGHEAAGATTSTATDLSR